MPTRWTMTDPSEQVVVQFDQKVLGKLVNPAHKVVFSLLDAHANEIGRLIDPRESVPERLFGLGPDEWVLRGENPAVAIVARRRMRRHTFVITARKRMLMRGSPPTTDQELSPSVPPEMLQQICGRTEAESLVALGLANGHSVEEIAELHNVRDGMVRSRIGEILEKLG
jgi:DNA-binding NarL/FixJ family response regulator